MQAMSKAGAREVVFRGWGRLQAPPCLCSAPPFLPSCSVFWALVREVLSK